jgi:hypothetical protein
MGRRPRQRLGAAPRPNAVDWCAEKPGLTATHRLPTPRPPPRSAPTAQATAAAPESGSLPGSAAGLCRVPSAVKARVRAEPCRKRRRKPVATCSSCPSASRPPFRRNDAPVHPTPVWGVTCQFVVSGRGRRTLGLRSAEFSDRHAVGIIRPDLEKKRRGRRERRPLGPAWVNPLRQDPRRQSRKDRQGHEGCRYWDAVRVHVKIVLPLQETVGGSTLGGLDHADQGHRAGRVSGGVAVR